MNICKRNTERLMILMFEDHCVEVNLVISLPLRMPHGVCTNPGSGIVCSVQSREGSAENNQWAMDGDHAAHPIGDGRAGGSAKQDTPDTTTIRDIPHTVIRVKQRRVFCVLRRAEKPSDQALECEESEP